MELKVSLRVSLELSLTAVAVSFNNYPTYKVQSFCHNFHLSIDWFKSMWVLINNWASAVWICLVRIVWKTQVAKKKNDIDGGECIEVLKLVFGIIDRL